MLLSLVAPACEPIRSTPLHPVGAGGLVPTRRDPDAGLVATRAGFDLRAYRAIEVDSFAVTGSPTWEPQDMQIVSAVTAFFQTDLVGRLRATGLFGHAVYLAGSPPPAGPTGVLRLEGTISRLELDYLAPARYRGWVGPGAVEVEARLVDVASGAVVLVTADRRTARYQTSAARDVGGTVALLEEVFSSLASDLVRFLVRRDGSAPPSRPARG